MVRRQRIQKVQTVVFVLTTITIIKIILFILLFTDPRLSSDSFRRRWIHSFKGSTFQKTRGASMLFAGARAFDLNVGIST
jgi:hypothetical protein